jgi:23S rRNA pseudouridine2605 synthase
MNIEEQQAERSKEKTGTDSTHAPKKVVLLPKRKRPRVGQVVTPTQAGDHPHNNRRTYAPREGGYTPRVQRPFTPRPNDSTRPFTPRPSVGNRPQEGWTPRPRPSSSSSAPQYGRQKIVRYKDPCVDPAQPIRLNKFIANAGVCSRREADEYITSGAIKVNGVVVTELGTKVTRLDKVFFHEKEVCNEGRVYVLLNKPKNCVATTNDPEGRLTVSKLVRSACRERIYPVGRLDRNTTGVILLTNDGDLASKLIHPSYNKKKIYHVWLDKEVTTEDLQKIATGIELEDGEIHADAISYPDETDQKQIGIELHSGRNHLVRRIFRALGYDVVKLDRVYFAGLTKKNLARGKWRFLNEREVNALRMGIFE